jgi:hypothetical protein
MVTFKRIILRIGRLRALPSARGLAGGDEPGFRVSGGMHARDRQENRAGDGYRCGSGDGRDCCGRAGNLLAMPARIMPIDMDSEDVVTCWG